jgi:1-acyl-sn-glycerol-3-phosphate acyltransferase
MNLMTERRFAPYFATQFLGACNDNVFKNALVILLTYKIVSSHSSILVNLAAVVFILPFFLFSPLAGQIADKYEKSHLIRRIKWIEIGIMVLGATGIYLNSIPWLMGVLFIMGAQSTFFGPIKYSILPQHLSREELMGGNALVEGGTFLAILFGTILGGVLAGLENYVFPVSVAIICFSILGLLSSYLIPPAQAEAPDLQIDYNPIRSGAKIFASLKTDKSNFYTAFGISWFWFFGATFLTQIPNFSREYLNGSPYVATLLMAMFSIGIGIGSLLSSKLSRGRVELGLVPIGALGMTVCGAWLGLMQFPVATESMTVASMFSSWFSIKALLLLVLLAVFGGLYIVPLYAWLQSNSPKESLSRNIAANNILNSLLMVIAGIFAIICFALGNTIQSLFFITALLNAVVGLFIFHRVPEFTLQLSAWLLTHSLYRVGKKDLHHIPKEGAALLACNHVSFVDPMVIGALSPRPIRFVMYHKIYNMSGAHWLFKNARAIPIAPQKEDPVLLQKAYDDIAAALNNGELVCIFPEGGLTPDGTLQELKPGIERILERTPVPVVPLALSGLWGTWFSRVKGKAMKGWPRNWMKKIDLIAAQPVPARECNLDLLATRIETLRTEA